MPDDVPGSDFSPIKIEIHDIIDLKAIPPEAYNKVVNTVTGTFEQVVSPLTATLGGAGRMIKESFDQWSRMRQIAGYYAVAEAIERAEARRAARGAHGILPPPHIKTFMRSFDEASHEADPTLREMWINLLASQLSGDDCHPYFAEVLANFGPDEARVLMLLKPLDQTRGGGPGGGGIGTPPVGGGWTEMIDGTAYEWTLSCTLLVNWGLALVGNRAAGGPHGCVLLYRCELGSSLLAAVS